MHVTLLFKAQIVSIRMTLGKGTINVRSISLFLHTLEVWYSRDSGETAAGCIIV